MFNDEVTLRDAGADAEVARRQFRWIAAEMRLSALRGARALLRAERQEVPGRDGCACVAEFAERNGMSAYEARRLVDLGRGLEAFEDLDRCVRAGVVPVDSGAVLGQVATSSEAVRGDLDWMAMARAKSTKELRRIYLERRDEVRAGAPVFPVTAYVTPEVRRSFSRARDLTSRRAHVAMTLGEALGVVVDEWLDVHDVLRTTEGVRRVPDTTGTPDRHVPAAVDRQVRRRSDDTCVVPYCGMSLWLERSHRVAHARGGSREGYNLDLLCDLHHMLYEDGEIRLEGSPDAPLITDRWGRPLSERRPYDYGPLPGDPDAVPTAVSTSGPAPP